jgi:hypothetical protein
VNFLIFVDGRETPLGGRQCRNIIEEVSPELDCSTSEEELYQLFS